MTRAEAERMMDELQLHTALNSNRWSKDPSLRESSELRYRRTAEAMVTVTFEEEEDQ